MLRNLLGGALLVVAATVSFYAQAAGSTPAPLYRLVRTVHLGVPDGWDYATFDPSTDRVYVSHRDRVTVVDGKSGRIIGEVKGMPGGTHGIVISHAHHVGFTDDGRAGQAVAFDPSTLEVVARIKAQKDADGIVLDPASGHVFVIDGDSGKLTVIDPANDHVVATIDVGAHLEFGVADGEGNLYVNGVENNDIVHIDTKTNKVVAHWPIPMCKSPHGMAIDRKTRRLFVSCENKVMVVANADNGAVVAKLPIGVFSDAAAFDPVRHRAFSSNGEGTITVVDEKNANTFTVAGTVKTELGARTMTLDPRTGRLYLVGGDYVVHTKVPQSDIRHRYTIKHGSAKLMFLDPI